MKSKIYKLILQILKNSGLRICRTEDMDNKKLSIITICYNEPNVEKTCKSIVNQTWQNFEWIVIDGGSKKETLDILKKYQDRIDKFISEPDNGIYNAINKGVRLSYGEYVNCLNAGDCYYNNNVLFEIFENIKFKGEILYGNTHNIFKDCPEKKSFYKKQKQNK